MDAIMLSATVTSNAIYFGNKAHRIQGYKMFIVPVDYNIQTDPLILICELAPLMLRIIVNDLMYLLLS